MKAGPIGYVWDTGQYRALLPDGRAGKGTLERIITELVPPDFRSAVSPFKWNSDYHLADLNGSRLNVVGELPEGQSIPAANFKSVLGRDLLASRQLYRSVVSFRNEAAHIFTSNHFVTTGDHSPAFYARWLLVEFPNSLLRTGGKIDTGLAKRIIATEMPGIADWAIRGGMRVLRQDGFSPSIVQQRLMVKWRQRSSTVDEFISECCELREDLYERRSAFYLAYAKWCTKNGLKPRSNSEMKAFMQQRIGLAVRFATLDGHNIIRGIGFTEQHQEEITSLGT